jgi:hypothetical protein
VNTLILQCAGATSPHARSSRESRGLEPLLSDMATRTAAAAANSGGWASQITCRPGDGDGDVDEMRVTGAVHRLGAYSSSSC